MGRKPLGDRPMTSAERQRRRRAAPSRIVIRNGGAWRLSAIRYERLVSAVRAGQPYDLDDFGTFLGVVANLYDDAFYAEMKDADSKAAS